MQHVYLIQVLEQFAFPAFVVQIFVRNGYLAPNQWHQLVRTIDDDENESNETPWSGCCDHYSQDFFPIITAGQAEHRQQRSKNRFEVGEAVIGIFDFGTLSAHIVFGTIEAARCIATKLRMTRVNISISIICKWVWRMNAALANHKSRCLHLPIKNEFSDSLIQFCRKTPIYICRPSVAHIANTPKINNRIDASAEHDLR